MIVSAVSLGLELVVRVEAHDATGQAHPIESVIDTGFAGELSLPASVVAALGLPFVHQGFLKLSDGTVVSAPVHRMVVVWDGAIRIVLVHATGGAALLGMGMLRDFDLRARCRPGGAIEIEAAR